MKKQRNNIIKPIFLILAIIFLVTLSACESTQPQEEPEELPPSGYPVYIGDEIIEEKPLRVVTLSPALTDTFVALGLEGRITGVSDNSHMYLEQDELYDYISCGTPIMPDVDAIISADPDVVFTSAPLTQSTRTTLLQSNIITINIEYAEDFEGIFDNYRTIFLAMHGNIYGNEEADRVVAAYNELIDEYSQVNADNSLSESIAYMREPLLTLATGDTFWQILFDIWAVDNWGLPYENWNYPEDKSIELDPDILLYSPDVDIATVIAAPMYATTSCVLNNKLLEVNYHSVENQSPTMFEEIRRVSAYLYPDAYVRELPEDFVY